MDESKKPEKIVIDLEDLDHDESRDEQVPKLTVNFESTNKPLNDQLEPGATRIIDNQAGNLSISELAIGDKVTDHSWEWEYRNKDNYKAMRKTIKKPVEWIIVAKNHYEGIGPHVTLLSVECIACYAFDDAGFWGREGDVNLGCFNLWALSGTHEARIGLRPWLNSIDINEGAGFYEAFSNDFKSLILTTPVPNKDAADNKYVTLDNVFVPSTTELGDIQHRHSHPIGNCYPYFGQASNKARVTALPGRAANWPWWTRSPDKVSRVMCSNSLSLAGRFFDEVVGVDMKKAQEYNEFIRRNIDSSVGGEGLKFGKDVCVIDRGNFSYTEANEGYRGVRPVVNVNANALVKA